MSGHLPKCPWSWRIAGRAGLLSLLLGTPLVAQQPVVKPLTIRVPIWQRDTLGLRRGSGGLIVIVRNVESPVRPVQYGYIHLLQSPGEQPRSRSASHALDSLGLIRIDSVPQGRPFLLVRAIGYKALVVPIEVVAGCTTHVEVYMSAHSCDLGPCFETSPRSTLTICQKPDA
jgi:hypothetical protein